MDDLKKYIREREKREPGFAALVDAAVRRRAFGRELAELRKARGQSQTQVAAAMNTSPSIVSRVESGADVQVSTLDKYLTAIGHKLVLTHSRIRTRKTRRKRAA